MANAIYPKFKEAALSGDTDLTSATVKAALVDTGTYTYATTHDFYDDVSSAVIGTPVELTTKTVTNGSLNSDDVTWTSVTGNSIEAIVLYIDTGTAGTSQLIAYLDQNQTGLPITPDGGNITYTVAAGGWFTL